MSTYVTGTRREELRLQAVEKYTGGKSVRRIAAEMNYSYGAVHALLAEAGIRFRPRGYQRPTCECECA